MVTFITALVVLVAASVSSAQPEAALRGRNEQRRTSGRGYGWHHSGGQSSGANPVAGASGYGGNGPPFSGNSSRGFHGCDFPGGNFSGGPPAFGWRDGVSNASGPPPGFGFDGGFGWPGNFLNGTGGYHGCFGGSRNSSLGPPPFGPHPGRDGPLGSIFGLFQMPNMTNITCPDAGEPTCASDPFGTEGTWVCRTLYSPWTGVAKEFSACINPTTSIAGDSCGCCGGTCPSECTCSCVTFDGKSGVRVMDKDNRTGHDLCVPPENAIAMVAMGPFSCVANCG